MTEAVLERPPLADEIDILFDIREDIRRLEAQVKDKKAVYAAKEAELMARLEQEGNLQGARGRRASVSLSESVVAHVENWDEFYRWIRRNNAFHLLQRRVSDGAFREVIATRSQPLPGVVPFTKKGISLRVNT